MSIYVKYMSFYVKICAKVLFPDDKTDFFIQNSYHVSQKKPPSGIQKNLT